MEKIKNILIPGPNGKSIALDIFYQDNTAKPVIVYAHGFNGFKDWGNFDLIAERFTEAGFTFVKFNFSHNGTSPEQPEEFVDLEAYAENNYTTELEDLERVISYTLGNDHPGRNAIDPDQLFLIGHSMGGGIVLVKASEDPRVRGVATWASVGALTTPWGKWIEEKISQWQKEGVAYIRNGRTGQDMPLHYQLYKDFTSNKERLDVEKAVQKLRVPLLLCHGKQDEAVPVETAARLASLNDQASLFILDSDHVFCRRHPWTQPDLPEDTRQVVERTIKFFHQPGIGN